MILLCIQFDHSLSLFPQCMSMGVAGQAPGQVPASARACFARDRVMGPAFATPLVNGASTVCCGYQ